MHIQHSLDEVKNKGFDPCERRCNARKHWAKCT